MWVTRRDRFSAAPITTAGGVRSAGEFMIMPVSAPSFREMAASLSQQVRTFNTTGKIQELRSQVASGDYRPDARETAARMLLLSEDE